MQWRHGRANPKEGTNPWTDDDFYGLGESDWVDFRNHWERYGVNNESCLEIGCGAGRITKQLAIYFKQVQALDVSDKMIEYAKRHVTSNSVTFHLSNGIDIKLESSSVYSIFSTQVFQHLDSLDIARNYFEEISRIIKPTGTIMIHLPICSIGSNTFRRLYMMASNISGMYANLRRLLMMFGIIRPIMRRLEYPIEFFYQELPKLGFADIEIFIFVTRSNNDPHPFVLARKKL